MSQGVNIQLYILQMLISLLTNLLSVNGGLLAEVCFYILTPNKT